MKKIWVINSIVFMLLSFSLSYAENGKLNFYIDTATFAIDEENTQVEIYYDIPYSELTFRKVGEKDDPTLQDAFNFIAPFEVEMEIIDMQGNQLAADTTLSLAGLDSLKRATNLGLYVTKLRNLVVTPGSFKLKIKVTDMESGKSAFKLTDIIAPLYFADNKIILSDIQLAAFIRPAEFRTSFYKNGMEVLPNPTNEFGDIYPNLYFYYEIYNLVKSEPNTFTKIYQIVNSTGEIVKSLKGGVGEKNAELKGQVGRISITDLPEGDYKLIIKVVDNALNQTAQKEHSFSIKYHKKQKLSSPITEDMIRRASGNELDAYFYGIKYIATKDELKKLEKLENDAEKREYLITFWHTRSMEENARHYRLVNLANKKYGTFNKQGWETDRGKVLIKYGMPDETERHTMEPLTPEYTIWRYFSLKGYFIFAETRTEGDLMLVDSNVPGEIYDPKWKSHTDKFIKGQKEGYLKEGGSDYYNR